MADIFGVSGRLMLHALIDGERDPQVLAELARSRMRGKIPALVEALTGRFDDHHAFLTATMLARIRPAGVGLGTTRVGWGRTSAVIPKPTASAAVCAR